jgi:hypothetical protein
MRHVVLAVGAAVLVATLGCSGGDGPALGRPTAATDPCRLLTREAIDDSTGWVVGPGTGAAAKGPEGQTVCNWESARTGAGVQVQLLAGQGRSAYGRRIREAESAGLGRYTDVTVPGAERAAVVVDHGLVAMLVGSDVIQLSVLGDPLPQQDLVGLATAAATRAA